MISYKKRLFPLFISVIFLGISNTSAPVFDLSTLDADALHERTEEINRSFRASRIAQTVGRFIARNKIPVAALATACYFGYDTQFADTISTLPAITPITDFLNIFFSYVHDVNERCTQWWPTGMLGSFASTFTINGIVIPSISYCLYHLTPLSVEQFVTQKTHLRQIMNALKQEAAALDPHSPVLAFPEQINISIDGFAAGDHRNRFVHITMRNIDELIGLKAYAQAHAIHQKPHEAYESIRNLAQLLINNVADLIAFTHYSGIQINTECLIQHTNVFCTALDQALEAHENNEQNESSMGALCVVFDFWRILETYIVSATINA